MSELRIGAGAGGAGERISNRRRTAHGRWENDRYWNRDGVPLVVTMPCDSNDAGMDLSDALARQLGVNRGPILWRFR